jgi:predicted nucleotidyltransferase
MLLNPTSSATIPAGLSVPVGVSLPVAIQRIVTELDPEKIILFGSYAYGDPTPDSDVDLLIIMETDKSSKDRSWAVSRLLMPRQFPVDIIVKNPSEIKQAIKENDPFLNKVLTKGQVLYERGQ